MVSIPYSEVRAHLAETLKQLELQEDSVYISRRGEPAGVLMSVAQYERLVNQSEGPAGRLAAWRAKYTQERHAGKDEPDPWADVRNRLPTRPVTWPDDISDPEKT